MQEDLSPPGEDEVHVWVARPGALSPEELAACERVLSPDERKHAARFRFERHRLEATVSRALVRTTLARYVGRTAPAIAYRVGQYGRPDLDPACALGFNATNHPGLVAVAVSVGEEIGVDTEPLSRGAEILGVAGTVFSEPELDALEALPAEARHDRAVSLWTCKEAYIKARGLGFSASLHEIVVDFPPDAPPRIRFLAGYDDARGWRLNTRDAMGYRLAVALRSTPRRDRELSLVVREATWDAASGA
jgi:4'-phosphopantetheinyl transferase